MGISATELVSSRLPRLSANMNRRLFDRMRKLECNILQSQTISENGFTVLVAVHFVLLQLVLILFEGVGEGESEGGEDELKEDGL